MTKSIRMLVTALALLLCWGALSACSGPDGGVDRTPGDLGFHDPK